MEISKRRLVYAASDFGLSRGDLKLVDRNSAAHLSEEEPRAQPDPTQLAPSQRPRLARLAERINMAATPNRNVG